MSNFAEISCLSLPLAEKLSRYTELLEHQNPQLASLYSDLVVRLVLAEAGRTAPKAGDLFPPFVLPDPQGHLVSTQELLKSGPLIVSFNRGHWCPFCKLELLAFKEAYPEFQRFGANLVSILPEPAGLTRPLQSELALPFTLLSDMDNAVSLSLGLMISFGEQLKQSLTLHAPDGSIYKEDESWLAPIPATFLVGEDGRVLLADVNPDFRRRLDMQTLIATLDRTTVRICRA